MSRCKYSLSGLASLALLMAAGGCTFVDSFVPKQGATSDVIDRQQNLTVDDFRDLNNAKKLLEKRKEDEKNPVTPTAELGAPPIPDLAQVLAAPRAPKVANTKLVTLSVTDDVPLRDVLFELGRLAKVDIEVGPGLDKTGINLRATDRPFNEVIERIAELGNLRYTVKGDSIRVEKDLPYIKSYTLSFLNIVRSSTSSYNLTTSALSSGSSSGGSSSSSSSSSSGSGGVTATAVGTSGSTATINAKSDSDLWTSFDASIKEILAFNPADTSTTPGANGSTSTPVSATPGAAGASGGSGNYVLNREAGLLTVNATDRQHEMIGRFLESMTRNSSAQVLIEAKIVEVALTDQFASGVDWTRAFGNKTNDYISVGNFAAADPTSTTGSLIPTTTNSAATVVNANKDLGTLVSLVQTFGTTRTLSSPRLSAINNQQAILTFARNEVYFTCTTSPSTVTASTTPVTTSSSTTCSPSAVPIGIILNVLPTIDLDTQEITLNVRPTLTREVGTVANPVQTGENVPVIEVREIDSIAKLRSGGVMIIGGLMQDTTDNTDQGVPGVGELPIFGNLFKSRSENATKQELIIFIKATIVNSDGSTHPVDRAIYKKYMTDPRQLFPEQK